MTVPPVEIEWDPIPEGVMISLKAESGPFAFQANMRCVRELRDDMEEANFLARGFEKIETFVADIEPGDQLRILGDTFTTTNTLRGHDGWVVQFEPNEHYDAVCELTLPHDMQVTVFRSVS